MSCGISSHRQPVLRTYKMPLITSRSLLRGRPNRFGLGNNRLIFFHWASLKSDRYALRGRECTGNSIGVLSPTRSEERRVGKECRTRRTRDTSKRNIQKQDIAN